MHRGKFPTNSHAHPKRVPVCNRIPIIIEGAQQFGSGEVHLYEENFNLYAKGTTANAQDTTANMAKAQGTTATDVGAVD